MADADRLLGMYLHLARASRLRRQPMVRVKLLVLAGVQAESMGLRDIAALCRHKVLAQNARHLLRRWPTFTDALSAEGFQAYLKQLRRRYSSEKIEHMMQSLGIEMGQEREAYFSDSEYAAALLDTQLEAIAEVVAQDPLRRRPEAPSAIRATGPRDKRACASLSDSRSVTDLLVVWAPFVAGLLALAAVAVASRALGV